MVAILNSAGRGASVIVDKVTIIALANSSDTVTTIIITCGIIAKEVAVVANAAVVGGFKDKVSGVVAAVAGDDVVEVLRLGAAGIGETVAAGHIVILTAFTGVSHGGNNIEASRVGITHCAGVDISALNTSYQGLVAQPTR